jgi:hypothetical protein
MTQRHILGDEICAPLKNNGDNGENQRELEGHTAKDTLIPIGGKSPAVSLPYAILTSHTQSWNLHCSD